MKRSPSHILSCNSRNLQSQCTRLLSLNNKKNLTELLQNTKFFSSFFLQKVWVYSFNTILKQILTNLSRKAQRGLLNTESSLVYISRLNGLFYRFITRAVETESPHDTDTIYIPEAKPSKDTDSTSVKSFIQFPAKSYTFTSAFPPAQ